MKYTRFILTLVISSLFISSIKLEAMETSCIKKEKTKPFNNPLKKRWAYSTNSGNLTRKRLQDLITNFRLPSHQTSLRRHQNSTNPVRTIQSAKAKRTTNTSHRPSLIRRNGFRVKNQQTLINNKQNNSKTDPGWIRMLVESCSSNRKINESENHLNPMKKLLNSCRIICYGPLNTFSGAGILDSLITQSVQQPE